MDRSIRRDPAALAADLGLIAGRDEDALARVYRSASPRLSRIITGILGSGGESEEVLQDVFLTVWRRAARFDDSRGGAITWLSTIARNRALDAKRAQRALPFREDLEAASELPDPEPSPLMWMQGREDQLQLEMALRKLDPRTADLIRTAFFDGVTYEALSLRTGEPLGTVKSLIRRGLVKMRGHVQR